MTDAATETARLLEDLRIMLEKGGEFVLAQAPPLAHEIILWGRVWNTTGALFVAVVLVLMIRSMRGTTKAITAELDDYNTVLPVHAIVSIVKGIVVAILMVGMFDLARSAIMAWCAPRLFVLDYVLNRIGGKH
jgi:hypothetical protein